jgi:uncharacterized ion transporter superfamily protein YfcC
MHIYIYIYFRTFQRETNFSRRVVKQTKIRDKEKDREKKKKEFDARSKKKNFFVTVFHFLVVTTPTLVFDP